MSEPEADNDQDEPSVSIQDGVKSVHHRNIDAAGEGHPFGEQPREFTADLRTLIRRVADDLYQSWEATIREYLANAETATLRVQEYVEEGESDMFTGDLIVSDSYEPKVEVTWDRREDKLTVKDNGIGLSADMVDEVFRHIGRSTNRDTGKYSGQFGQGVLSFVKFVGLDNAMIMTSHSRLNDDNAAYYVTLAGVEPIQGQLGENEYGTEFQLTPNDDYDVRQAVEKYAEWMRVPVIYREVDENGEEVFNEDWGDKALYEDYDEDICLKTAIDGAFEAYMSPHANGRTLLLSMEIERNDGSGSSNQHGAPFPFDVRLLDESGKVIQCGCPDNDHKGLIPETRSDYEQMLKQTRDPYITEDLLNKGDIVGQEITGGEFEGRVVVNDKVLEDNQPLPPGDYVSKSEVVEAYNGLPDYAGQAEVLIGPHQGRTIVPEEEWEQMDEGRAALYVPRSELTSYDLESGQGDLTLPQPTSDRDRLQEHQVFWEFVGKEFAEQFDKKVDEVYNLIEGSDDPLETIMELEPEDLVITPSQHE